jgi:hypothetical protein
MHGGGLAPEHPGSDSKKHQKPENWPSWESNRLAIVVYKRSWGEIFSPNFGKKEKEPKRKKGRPVETAAAVEIDKGSLRRFFLDDFHRCLKKPAQKPLRLFHSYTQARRRLTKQHPGYFLNELTIPSKVTFSNELIGVGTDGAAIAVARMVSPAVAQDHPAHNIAQLRRKALSEGQQQSWRSLEPDLRQSISRSG